MDIYDYIKKLGDGEVFFVEVGVHHGTDSEKMIGLFPGRVLWMGFEPDPRNVAVLREKGLGVIEAAVSDEEGEAEFWLSGGMTPGHKNREHTDSSSLQKPTHHLRVHPWCKFEERVKVKTVRLDDIVPAIPVDLMWVDVQGAQKKVIRGALETLKRTRWLYIECHHTPMYEDEPTFAELCGLLPGFRVVERWPSEVLFVNSDN